MISAKENLRALIDRQLGGVGISRDKRMADAIRARRCRNLFWNAIPPVVIKAGCPPDVIVAAQTPPFGNPVIITDILNYLEPFHFGFYPGVIWQLMRMFTSGVGAQEDFFSAGNFLCSLAMLGHYQGVTSGNSGDAPSIKQHFAPYLLRVGEIFQINWELLDFSSIGGGGVPITQQACLEADFRGLRVLPESDALGSLCGALKSQVCGYIDTYDTETFILDLRIPEASLPALGDTRNYSTDLQERPLLIYGISTNISGAQISMRDDGLRWEFVVPPTPPTQVVNAGVLTAGVFPGIQGIPIQVVANNGDLTLHEQYNMLPVPHLLAPNTSLTVRLTNGLMPDGLTGVYTQSLSTQNNFGDETGEAHIAFLCRSV